MSDVEFVDDPYICAMGCDAVVLMTDWEELTRLDLDKLRGLVRTPVFVDLRNAYDAEMLEKHGFSAVGVGRSAQSGPESDRSVPSATDVPDGTPDLLLMSAS
jgi:UDPglucose 6-dehydrogenase